MAHRNQHHTRALALVGAVEPQLDTRREVGLPESSRWIDALVPFAAPSDAWGPLRPYLAHRRVFLELYSRAVPSADLVTCVLKSVWGYEQWQRQRRAESAGRPPLCLVISDGRPRSGLRDLACFGACPDVGGLYRLDCGYQVLLVDAKRIRGKGSSFLRLLPTRPEERDDKLQEVLNDPDLSDATKLQIEKTMANNTVFGEAERESAAQALLKRGEKRGEKRGRRLELLDMAREAGASDDDLAELEAIEDLEALRTATLELAQRLA